MGVEGQTDIGNRTTDLRVLGTNASVTPAADRTMDAIFGAGLSYDLPAQGLEFYTDGEVSVGINKGGPSDNMGGTAKIGLKWTF